MNFKSEKFLFAIKPAQPMKMFLLSITLIACCVTQNAAQLKANVASIDITPPLDMKYTLGGYGERKNKPAEGIHDRISAKALVLTKGERKYALITLDILGLPHNVKPDLLKRISDDSWTPENLMLLPSHSHGSLEMAALNSRNVFNNVNIGIYHPELLEFLLDKLSSLVKAADKNFKSVKIGTSSIMVDELNRNRRKDPDVDRELTLTRIDQSNGKPLAVLINWTAHPTFISGKDMLVSAGWPGYLQSELETLIGDGVTVMYYNGAEGDQSPVLDGPIDAYEKIKIYGKKMADISFEVFNKTKTRKTKEFSYSYTTIDLPQRTAHPDFMKTGGEEYGLNVETVKVLLEAMCPGDVGLGSVRIGDLVIAGVPGEMAAGLGIKIKSSVEGGDIRYCTIGGLANEWTSYIISESQYLNGAGYESSVSFYGSKLGEVITNAVISTSAKCK